VEFLKEAHTTKTIKVGTNKEATIKDREEVEAATEVVTEEAQEEAK
jgi:hypothetical protein